jgi:L-alanine-DL-glutamate epimerase-like enolase superfamily enzyme
VNTRRTFLKALAAAPVGIATAHAAEAADPATPAPSKAAPRPTVDHAALRQILREPVLDLSSVKAPLKIASIELLKNGNAHLVRTRSTDGLEVITVPHQAKTGVLTPLLLKNVIPVFVGRDAREIEQLLWDVYRHADNYKLQGLALWVAVAAVEMGVLELLARSADRPIADFFGGAKRRDVAVYYASGNRGNTPEAETEYLQKLVRESGAKALKFRLGGRMSRNADSLPGRTEALIPLVRKTFGDAMTLYADSNSSYDAREGIRIGRIMEAHGYGFYEEPCEFDDLWSTKEVADALAIPVAGGEQEFSLHRWEWMIAERGVDIVQPDLHYGGGFIRATQVARMAAAAGMPVVPHMSGGGLGYLEVIHFASFTPNIGPHMEFKGSTSIPVVCDTSDLKCTGGIVRCPTGPGFGVTIDPEFVHAAKVVS